MIYSKISCLTTEISVELNHSLGRWKWALTESPNTTTPLISDEEQNVSSYDAPVLGSTPCEWMEKFISTTIGDREIKLQVHEF